MGHENGGWMNADQRDDATCGGTVVPIPNVSELLPCPFCGGQAYYTQSVNGSQMHYIGCSSCGIAFKAQETGGPGFVKLTKDIVAAWNKRAAPELLSALENIITYVDLDDACYSEEETRLFLAGHAAIAKAKGGV